MAYYSFPKKKIKVFESVKLKQQEVSSEVLVTAIDVKCNFPEQINANQGIKEEAILNIVTELLEGDWKLDTSLQRLFSRKPAVQPHLKNSGFLKARQTFFQKVLSDSFSVIIKMDESRRFCHL